MSSSAGHNLLLSDAVSREVFATALADSVKKREHLLSVLLRSNALSNERIAAELARWEGPRTTEVHADAELLRALPDGMARRLAAVPLRRDPAGWIDVAVADARDKHAALEMAYAMRAHVRLVQAPLAAITSAIDEVILPDSEGWEQTTVVQELPRAEPRGPLALAAMTDDRGVRKNPTRTPLWGTPIVNIGAAAEPEQQRRGSVELPIPLLRRSDGPPTIRESQPAGSIAPQASPAREGLVPIDDVDEPEPMTEPVFKLSRLSLSPTTPAAVEVPARAPIVVSAAPTPALAPTLPFSDPQPVIDAMDATDDRDALIALLQTGVRAVARRVGIFAVKRDLFVGWSCTAELGDVAAFRKIEIKTSAPSLLATVCSGQSYLGPFFRTEAHAPFLSFVKPLSHDTAVVCVKVIGRPTLIIVADELGDTALGTKRIDELAQAASRSLTKMLRARGRA